MLCMARLYDATPDMTYEQWCSGSWQLFRKLLTDLFIDVAHACMFDMGNCMLVSTAMAFFGHHS